MLLPCDQWQDSRLSNHSYQCPKSISTEKTWLATRHQMTLSQMTRLSSQTPYLMNGSCLPNRCPWISTVLPSLTYHKILSLNANIALRGSSLTYTSQQTICHFLAYKKWPRQESSPSGLLSLEYLCMARASMVIKHKVDGVLTLPRMNHHK